MKLEIELTLAAGVYTAELKYDGRFAYLSFAHGTGSTAWEAVVSLGARLMTSADRLATELECDRRASLRGAAQ